jgi:hypothetical protein
MFTPEQEQDLRNLHNQYVQAMKDRYPNIEPFHFTDIIKNVMDNAKEDEKDFYSLVKNVLDALIYTSQNSIEEMIERAEADYARRYEEMTEEQQRVCDNFRIPYDQFKEEIAEGMLRMNDYWSLEG